MSACFTSAHTKTQDDPFANVCNVCEDVAWMHYHCSQRKMHKKEKMSSDNLTIDDLHHVRSTPCSIVPPRGPPIDHGRNIPMDQRVKELQDVIAKARDELHQIRIKYEEDKKRAARKGTRQVVRDDVRNAVRGGTRYAVRGNTRGEVRGDTRKIVSEDESRQTFLYDP